MLHHVATRHPLPHQISSGTPEGRSRSQARGGTCRPFEDQVLSAAPKAHLIAHQDQHVTGNFDAGRLIEWFTGVNATTQSSPSEMLPFCAMIIVRTTMRKPRVSVSNVLVLSPWSVTADASACSARLGGCSAILACFASDSSLRRINTLCFALSPATHPALSDPSHPAQRP